MLANSIWGPACSNSKYKLGIKAIHCAPAAVNTAAAVVLSGPERLNPRHAPCTAATTSYKHQVMLGLLNVCALLSHLMMCSVSQFMTIFSPKLLPISPGVGSRAPKSCKFHSHAYSDVTESLKVSTHRTRYYLLLQGLSASAAAAAVAP